MRQFIILAALLVLTGCVGNNSVNCTWAADHATGALNLSVASGRRHLADDAQTAEDLAIRHADASRSPDWQRHVVEYHRVRETCKASLFAAVAGQHSVPVEAVAVGVTVRREWLDALVILSLVVLFILAARVAAAFLLRGALADSRALASSMIVVAAIAAGIVGIPASNVFVGVIESLRIGNGHMSYRVERLPLRHRRWETFASGAACFIAVSVIQFGRTKVRPYD